MATTTKSGIPTLEMAGEVYQLEVMGADIHAVRTINRQERDLILIGGGIELRERCSKDFGGWVGDAMEAEYIKQEIKYYAQKLWMYFVEIPE